MKARRAAFAAVLIVLVGVGWFASLPAEAQSSIRRSVWPFQIVTSYTGAALDTDQTGAGSMATFRDGGTSEVTIDQSGSTSINPLVLSGTGNVNGPQLDVRAAPTQGTPPVVVRNSSGTPVASISGAGALTVASQSGGDTTFTGNITQAVGNASGIENVGNLPTWQSAAITAASDAALWTVGSSEKWVVHRVICNITTNFDCTGDDCALIIGDGNDTDGFLVLADAEMQTADTEGTGFAAGWQGLVAATVGAYLDPEQTFVYAAADTIDIDIRDVSAGTDPSAGAGTCYINYTRLN